MARLRTIPSPDGVRTWLYELEAEVMELVWSRRWERFSVADVHRALQRRRPLAYTTVMTTVARLHAKGLLERRREGKRYVYRPRTSREGFLEHMALQVLQGLREEGTRAAVAFLAERIDQVDDAELRRLEALIQARRRCSSESDRR